MDDEIFGRDFRGVLLREGHEAPYGFRGTVGGVDVRSHIEGYGHGFEFGRYLAFRPIRSVSVEPGGERLPLGVKSAHTTKAREALCGFGARAQLTRDPEQGALSGDQRWCVRIEGDPGPLLTERTLEVVAAAFRALSGSSSDT